MIRDVDDVDSEWKMILLTRNDIAQIHPSELSLRALEALQRLSWQLDMGADEILLDAPVNRFLSAEKELEAQAQKKLLAKQKPAHPEAEKAPIPQQVDYALAFSNVESFEALFAKLEEIVPSSLTKMARQKINGVGVNDAEILVLVDPPSRDAERKGSLFTGPRMKLVDAAFQSVGLCHQEIPLRKKTADIAIHPVSPWRTPQDRALDSEELQCLSAYWARYFALGAPKVVLLQGDRLQGLLRQIIDNKLFGVNAERLISPAVMLADWRLKRDHWHRLLKLRDEISATK